MAEAKYEPIEQDDSPSLKKAKKRGFRPFNMMVRRGVEAGALMALLLILIEAFSTEDMANGLRFIQYLILGGMLYFALKRTRDYYPPNGYFQEGLKIGLGISVVSAITVILINFLSFILGGTLTMEKYTQGNESLGQFLMVNGILLFEIFVFGMIMTFIWLQLLKMLSDDSPDRANE